MKAFVFESIDKVSDNYHSDGGLFIVAKDKNRAIELINVTAGEVVVTEDDWNKVITYELLGEYEEALIAFPDAGCC